MRSPIGLCVVMVACWAMNCNVNGPSVNKENDISGFITASAQGCSDFSVYKSDSLKSKWIIVGANADSLHISGEPRRFDLKTESKYLHVHYDYYSINKDGTKQFNFIYCNDVWEVNAQMPRVFKAIDGYADISRSASVVYGPFHEEYKVTVKLQSVHLVDSLGTDTVYLKSLDMDSVIVGWLPG